MLSLKKMFKKINAQIYVLVLMLVLFQITIGVISYFSLGAMRSDLNQVFSVRLPSIDNLVQADRDFQQSLVAERTLLIDGVDQKIYEGQLKDYTKNRKQVRERFDKFTKLSDSKEEKAFIESFNKKFKEWEDFSDKNLLMLKDGFDGDRSQFILKSINEVSKYFENSRDDLDQLQELIQKEAEAEYKNAQDVANKSVRDISIIILCCFVLSAIFSIYIVKNITGKIKKAMDLINENSQVLGNISNDLSMKSSELSAISQEQSASVEETSSSLHEISQMVKKNTEIAVSSADQVNLGKKQLDDGIQLILNLAGRVKDVNEASRVLGKSVDENHERLSNILNVFTDIQNKTSVINDIVFQTKLLSFNASVEAARAGEHGKGFSVVAEEIGGLAQQSGKSANEISEGLETSFGSISSIIQRSKDEVYNAVKKNEGLIDECLKLSSEAESVLQRISGMFQHISVSSDEIAQASREQNAGVEEINSAVQEISDTNQTTASRSHEVESLAKNIDQITEDLHESLKDLNALI